MNPARWQQVEAIAAAAMDRAADERAAFLDDACADDAALRREVESLLGFETAADGFLQQTAMEEAARLVASDADRLAGELAIEGYEICEFLGAGGMGDVYRARDIRLDRDVALKVIQHAARDVPSRKVEDEARTASSLSHPNIVTIHAVGSRQDLAFIVMELVTGRTLRELLADGPLALTVTVDIALQLAEALGAAHAAGIVHRDLKPDNVMVTPDGLVKVLDFGIAKRERGFSRTAAQDARSSSGPTSAHSTLAGTAGYMSPEQAARRPVDYRSDQFSFGAILYEMLSGRRAFERGTKSETIDAVIEADFTPLGDVGPSVPRALTQVVDRCLRREPEQRYLNKREPAIEIRRIRDELLHERAPHGPTRRQAILLGGAAILSTAGGLAIWRLGASRGTIRRLAVLPLRNPAGDENTEILCDGITEVLIRQLGRMTDLEVMGRGTVFAFKDRTQDPREVGRQLGADLVMTGSVSRRGERAVVEVELADGKTGAYIWGDDFNRQESDVLAIQHELAATIIRESLGKELSESQRQQLSTSLTSDGEAYRLFLRAIHHFRRDTEMDLLMARQFLTEAVTRDRTFALAHLTLASTYSVMALDGYQPPHDAWARSRDHVTRALEQDPELPDAYAERAAESFFYRWDWAAARREWDLALNRRRAEIQPELLTSYVLQQWALGQTTDALKFAQAARAIDPVSAMLAVREADLLAYSGNLPAAETLYRKVMDAWPKDTRAYFGLADVLSQQGRFDDAIAACRLAFQMHEDESLDAVLPDAHGREGYRRLERYLAALELAGLEARSEAGLYVSPLYRARAHARLGNTDNALNLLEEAFADKAAGLALLKVDRAWNTVRTHPRFVRAIRRVGLPS